MNFYNRIKQRERIFQFVFIVGIFALLFSWAIMQPFNSCPDEKMRFVIPEYIYNNLSLPDARDESLFDMNYGFSYASKPMLSYIISALFMEITSLFTKSDFILLIAARMTSVLSGVIYSLFIIKLSRFVSNRISIKWLFIILCTLWPQMCFVFTYVNCDGMAMLSVAIMIYYWFKVFYEGCTVKNCIAISVGISISLLTYYNTYIIIVFSFVLFVLYFIFIDKSQDKAKRFISRLLLVVSVVFLLAGWHFIRNGILYDGQILQQDFIREYGEKYALPGYKPSERAALAREYMLAPFGLVHWFNSTFISLIGSFGYMSVPLYNWMYLIYIVEIGLGLIGVCVWFFKIKFRVFKKKYILYYIIFLTIPIVVCFSIYYSFSDYQPQGRYILPALIPICFILTKGIEHINKRLNKWLVLLICVLNAVIACGCLFIIHDAYTGI